MKIPDWVRPPLNHQRPRRRFELKTDLTAGSTATAYLQRWDPSANTGDGGWKTLTKEFTVTDIDGNKGGADGNEGWAEKYETDNGTIWIVAEMIDLRPTIIYSTASSASAAATSTVSLNTPTVMQPNGGSFDATDDPAPTSATKIMAWDVASGGKILAFRQGHSTTWYAIPAPDTTDCSA